jgi:hypothetical protein
MFHISFIYSVKKIFLGYYILLQQFFYIFDPMKIRFMKFLSLSLSLVIS